MSKSQNENQDKNSDFKMSDERKLRKFASSFNDVRKFRAEYEGKGIETLKEAFLRLKNGVKTEEDFTNVLPKAIAIVSRALESVKGFELSEKQIEAAVVMASGNLAQVKTGEGKTEISTVVEAVRTMMGHVHFVSTQQDLVEKDFKERIDVFKALGITTGVLRDIPGYSEEENWKAHKEAYSCEVTLGTMSSFVFDYLKHPTEEIGRTSINIDEIDSIAMEQDTPYIMSGSAGKLSSKYYSEDLLKKKYEQIYQFLDRVMPPSNLKTTDVRENLHYIEKANVYEMTLDQNFIKKHLEHYDKDSYPIVYYNASHNVVRPNRAFYVELEKQFGPAIYKMNNELLSLVENSLVAKCCLQQTGAYQVNQATGRIELRDAGGKFSDSKKLEGGLHQAVEAMHGIETSSIDDTVAMTTVDNYLGHYKFGTGCSATIEPVAGEFRERHGWEYYKIGSRFSTSAKEEGMGVYNEKRDKYTAIIKDMHQAVEEGRPVYIACASEATLVELAKRIKTSGMKGIDLLQTYNFETKPEEVDTVITNAGKPGTVTITTGLGGRGTNVKVDPNIPDGMFVQIAEVLESEREVRQVAGRTARNGNEGVVKQYASLEDDFIKANRRGAAKKYEMDSDGKIVTKKVLKEIEEAVDYHRVHTSDSRVKLGENSKAYAQGAEKIYDLKRKVASTDRLEVGKTVRGLLDASVDEIRERCGNNKKQFMQQVAILFPGIRDLDAKFVKKAKMDDLVFQAKVEAGKMYRTKVCRLTLTEQRQMINNVLDQNIRKNIEAYDDMKVQINLAAGLGQKEKFESFENALYANNTSRTIINVATTLLDVPKEDASDIKRTNLDDELLSDRIRWEREAESLSSQEVPMEDYNVNIEGDEGDTEEEEI